MEKVIQVKLTTIQVSEETRKKLESKKAHPRESYNEVIMKILENEEIPSMEEMFRKGDSMKQSRQYSTKEIIELSHALRARR